MTVTGIGTIYRYQSDRKAWSSTARAKHILSYQVTGHYDHDFGDRTLAVRAGSLFFIRADEAYSVTRREAGEAICVTIAMDGAPPSAVYDCLHEPRVGNLFHRLYTLRHIEVQETRCAAMAVIYELLSVMAAHSAPVNRNSGTADRLAAAERYIHTHFRDGEIRVDTLAALSGLGKKQFTALFTRQYHTTPAQYVIDLRLGNAATLLAEGLGVCAVSEAVGFSDVSYFSKLFKRRFAIPPSQYARKGAT